MILPLESRTVIRMSGEVFERFDKLPLYVTTFTCFNGRVDGPSLPQWCEKYPYGVSLSERVLTFPRAQDSWTTSKAWERPACDVHGIRCPLCLLPKTSHDLKNVDIGSFRSRLDDA